MAFCAGSVNKYWLPRSGHTWQLFLRRYCEHEDNFEGLQQGVAPGVPTCGKLKFGIFDWEGLSNRHSRVEYLAYFARQSARGEWLSDESRSFVQHTVMNDCIVGIARHVEHFHVAA